MNKQFNIVQIGANKGANSNNNGPDDFYLTIKDLNISKLVLVEPLSIHLDALKERYANFNNTFIENVAITPEESDKFLDFFYHKNDGPLFLVASCDPNHILKHGFSRDGIVKNSVPCMSMTELFKKHGLKEIDILCIDTEGLDGEILKSINHNEFKIKQIYYEYIHQKFNIANFLMSKGYSIYNSWRDTKTAILN